MILFYIDDYVPRVFSLTLHDCGGIFVEDWPAPNIADSYHETDASWRILQKKNTMVI